MKEPTQELKMKGIKTLKEEMLKSEPLLGSSMPRQLSAKQIELQKRFNQSDESEATAEQEFTSHLIRLRELLDVCLGFSAKLGRVYVATVTHLLEDFQICLDHKFAGESQQLVQGRLKTVQLTKNLQKAQSKLDETQAKLDETQAKLNETITVAATAQKQNLELTRRVQEMSVRLPSANTSRATNAQALFDNSVLSERAPSPEEAMDALKTLQTPYARSVTEHLLAMIADPSSPANLVSASRECLIAFLFTMPNCQKKRLISPWLDKIKQRADWADQTASFRAYAEKTQDSSSKLPSGYDQGLYLKAAKDFLRSKFADLAGSHLLRQRVLNEAPHVPDVPLLIQSDQLLTPSKRRLGTMQSVSVTPVANALGNLGVHGQTASPNGQQTPSSASKRRHSMGQ